MCLLDSLALLFPGASVTLAVVLFGLLASSAAGGLLSARIGDRGLRRVLAGASLLLAALALSLPCIVHALLPLGLALRVAGALVLTGIPGVLLGIPFPAAMRGLGGTGPRRAYAWAVNGSASVLASTGSALVAMSAGWRVLGLLAAASYAAAAILLPSARSQMLRKDM
jgi:MFS family permease